MKNRLRHNTTDRLQYPGIIIPYGGTANRNIDKDGLATPDPLRPCMYACANRISLY